MWFLPDFRQVYDPFKLNMDKNRERHFNCCGTPKVGFLYFPSFSEFFDSTLSKMRALPQFSCFCCFETTPSFRSAERHDSVRHASSVFFPYARFSSKSFSSPALLGLIRKFGPVPPSGKQGSSVTASSPYSYFSSSIGPHFSARIMQLSTQAGAWPFLTSSMQPLHLPTASRSSI